MSTGTIVLIVVLIIAAIVFAGMAASIAARRRRLQERFGPEYDRLVAERGSRRLAEAELGSRARRVAGFSLRPISDEAYTEFSARWAQVQERFVDTPAEAVADAQTLIEAVMRERGYPADDYRRELEDLSVEHATVLAHFRSAHASAERAASGTASTEELREAMISYRELFGQLLARDVGSASREADVAPEVMPDGAIPGEAMPEAPPPADERAVLDEQGTARPRPGPLAAWVASGLGC